MNLSAHRVRRTATLVTAGLMAVLFSSHLQAEKPRWEVGLAGAYVSGFDYPASNDPNQRSIALPYFIYRTPVFRLGDGGIRAIAIERPTINLDVSVSGSLNASSQGNRARAGMPDLDFLFEIGPRLKVRLFDKELDKEGRLQATFTTELRAVLATDFRGIDGQGFVAEAGIGIVRRGYLDGRLALVGLFDVTFASEPLHDYFYEVAPEFVTENRPLHDARGGYLGSSLFLGVGYRFNKRFRLFLGGVAGLYGGAANDDSPLFETRESFGYAVGFSWTLATSEQMIDVEDIEVSRSE